MKFSSLLFIIFLYSISLSAQSTDSESTVQKFVKQFNEKKIDDIYNTFSAAYQQKIAKKDLQSYLNQIYGMAGKFRSATFKSFENSTYNYLLIAKNEEISADFLFIIDENKKIDYLNFKRIGGTGNPPPISKIISVNP